MKTARMMETVRPLGFLLLALPFLLAAGPKGCAIDVQCGDLLAFDYGQYKLNGDLVCPDNPSDAAVTITGEGVHFNLRGYTITRGGGSGRFLKQGIAVRGANAHINNGSIVDINCPIDMNQDCTAIRLFEAPGARINGMSLHNNTVGIVSFSFGGVVGNADGARIHGNDITGNLRFGIGLFGSAEGAMISDNDLSDTGGFPGSLGAGLGYLGSSDGVSLVGNVANNNAAVGIALFGGEAEGTPERNTIRDNTTLDNGRAGITLIGGTEEFRPRDNLIQSNTAFGNGLEPGFDWDLNETVVGVGPAADCLNTWKDNDFDVAGVDCIE
jgi:parallel beta-helix repeat protein